jgi:hypothetical protein
MHRIAAFLVLVAAFAALGVRALITEDEALVSSVLKELKFESAPNKPNVIGAPPRLVVTKKTLAHLEQLMKQNQTIEVQPNGTLKIVPAK